MQKLLIILTCIGLNSLSFFKTANGQESFYRPFFNHLMSNDCSTETLDYLKQCNHADSVTFEIANFYYNNHNFDSAFVYYTKLNQRHDSGLIKRELNSCMLSSYKSLIFNTLHESKPFLSNDDYIDYTIITNLFNDKTLPDDIHTSDSVLSEILQKFKSHKTKSAILAGILSSVVPGLGKQYLGYKKQAKGAFISNLILGASATEILIKSSNITPKIIIIGALSTFYIGNIWGTVILAHKREIDFRNQLRYDIKNHILQEQSNQKQTEILNDTAIVKSLLEIEKRIFTTQRKDSIETYIYEKAELLKQQKDYVTALQNINRIETTQIEHLYKKSFIEFNLKMYDDAYNSLVLIPDSVKSTNPEICLLWKSILIEKREFSKCRSIMLQMVDSSSMEYKAILSLDTLYRFKSPLFARRVSTYMPGSGLLYSGNITKGLTNISMETGSALVLVSLLRSNYYVNSIIWGLYPFFRFYIGGLQLSYKHAVNCNEKNQQLLKGKYYNLIFKHKNLIH